MPTEDVGLNPASRAVAVVMWLNIMTIVMGLIYVLLPGGSFWGNSSAIVAGVLAAVLVAREIAGPKSLD